MRNKKLAPVVIASMLAFSLSFTGANQAQARYKLSVVIHDYSGVTDWFDTESEALSAKCDYLDGIHEGNSVMIGNGARKLIAKSPAVKFKKRAIISEEIDDVLEYGIVCQASTTVSVPKSSFYLVSAGTRYATFSFSEVVKQKWKVVLGEDYLSEGSEVWTIIKKY